MSPPMPRHTSSYRASTTPQPTVYPAKSLKSGDVLPAIDCAHCGKRHPLYVFNLCRDQPHFESVCLSHKAQRKFWRISYYGEEPDQGPAFVSYGPLPDAKGKQAPPKGRLLPHTQGVADLDKRVEQKLKAGYRREASASAYTPYLRFDDLRAMKEGTEFEVAENSDTGGPASEYYIMHLRIAKHLKGDETLVEELFDDLDTPASFPFWKTPKNSAWSGLAYFGDGRRVVMYPHPQDLNHADGCMFCVPGCLQQTRHYADDQSQRTCLGEILQP